MRYGPVDRPPLHLVGVWGETLARWRDEGLPGNVDVNEHLGVRPMRATNISGRTGLWPPFERRTLREDARFIYLIHEFGRTAKQFKDHESMPEWIDYPVKTADDLARIFDEHMDVSDLEARYAPEWEATARELGIELTWYDSDGSLNLLLPDYLAVGIDCVAPCEVAADMAPTDLRRRFGTQLRMIGGIDKRRVAEGPDAIDAELRRIRPAVEQGGYLPAIDHSVSADIGFDEYRYFLDRLCAMLGVERV